MIIVGIQVTPILVKVFTKKPDGLDTFQISYVDFLKSLAFYAVIPFIRFAHLAAFAVIHNKCGATPKHTIKTVVVGTVTNFKGVFACLMAVTARYGFSKTRQEVGDLILFHAVC